MQIKVKKDSDVMAKHLANTEMALHFLELASDASDPRELVLAAQDVMAHNPEAFAEWLRGMQDARKRLDAIRATFATEVPTPKATKPPIPLKALKQSRPADTVEVKSVKIRRIVAHA